MHPQTCLSCTRPDLTARGLCTACYKRHYTNGTLAQFPLTRVRQSPIRAPRGTTDRRTGEFFSLVEEGFSTAEALRQVGCTATTMETALWRAGHTGTPELARLRRLERRAREARKTADPQSP